MTKVSEEDIKKAESAMARGFRLIAATPVVGVAWSVAPIPVPLLVAVANLWAMHVSFVAALTLSIIATKMAQEKL